MKKEKKRCTSRCTSVYAGGEKLTENLFGIFLSQSLNALVGIPSTTLVAYIKPESFTPFRFIAHFSHFFRLFFFSIGRFFAPSPARRAATRWMIWSNNAYKISAGAIRQSSRDVRLSQAPFPYSTSRGLRTEFFASLSSNQAPTQDEVSRKQKFFSSSSIWFATPARAILQSLMKISFLYLGVYT